MGRWFKFINWQYTNEELLCSLEFFSKKRAHIREYIEKLSWDSSENEQIEAIDYLAKNLLPCEYIFLIFADKYTHKALRPYDEKVTYYEHEGGKERWENAAKTIIKIGWPKVDHIIIPMFMWLLDVNWPGSMLIREFLLTLPKEVLERKIHEVSEQSCNYGEKEYDELSECLNELVK